ncbi:MAG: hypothetical protein ACR2KX_09375 [Chitinophagaceae bacterium]
METLTHLKTSADFVKKDNKTYSQLVIDKFTEACMHLDASIFEPYMNEDDVFEDLEKYKFLVELKDLFDYSQFKTDYNFSVNLTNKKCKGCQKGKPVLNFEVVFAGTKLPVGEFGFLIDGEDGILKDIYRCNLYKENQGFWWKHKAFPTKFISKKRF